MFETSTGNDFEGVWGPSVELPGLACGIRCLAYTHEGAPEMQLRGDGPLMDGSEDVCVPSCASSAGLAWTDVHCNCKSSSFAS